MKNDKPHTVSVCIGSAPVRNELEAFEGAKSLGRTIARSGGTLLIPAQSGIPLWAAMGAKEEGGVVVGISPASSQKEHEHILRLPRTYMDTVIYAGDDARAQQMIAQSAKTIVACAGPLDRLEALSEAQKQGSSVGLLKGSWHDATEMDFHTTAHLHADSDPERLLRKLFNAVIPEQ